MAGNPASARQLFTLLWLDRGLDNGVNVNIMMGREHIWLLMILLAVAGSACDPRPSIPTSASLPTLAHTPTPPLLTHPLATAKTRPQRLIICLGSEPVTLYRYGDTGPVTKNIWGAIYDGPIDQYGYEYYPVILEKLPSLEDGDALIETVQVSAGERIIDADGQIVRLAAGMTVKVLEGDTHLPKEVVYQGGTITLERLVVIFKLKDGLAWSDGEPLTAEDSVFSFRMARYRLPPHPTVSITTPGWEDPNLINRTADYKALDDRTVEWVGMPGYLDPNYFLNFYPPLPRHALEQYGPGELPNVTAAARLPLGWGAFRIVAWTPGREIRLERNPHYFRATEGLPRVDEVVFRFGSPQGVLSELLAGQCHIATRDATFPFKSELPVYQGLEQSDLLQVKSVPGSLRYLAFGINPRAVRPDFFGDVQVRQAIAYGTHRQALIDALPEVSGAPPQSYLPPQHPFYLKDETPLYSYDPEQARALLAQAGWVDSDGDGIVDREGLPFSVRAVASAGDLEAAQVLWLFQQDMATIGIRVAIESQPIDKLYTQSPDGLLFGRHYDLALMRGGINAQPSCDLFLSEAIPGPENSWMGRNISGYSNLDFDMACRRGLTTLDRVQARDYHIQAQQIFIHDVPALPLFFIPQFDLARPEIGGVDPQPGDGGELWNIEEIKIGSHP